MADNFLCVFCGSSPGKGPSYQEESKEIAKQMQVRGWGLVYGGASIGIMGQLADQALAQGLPVYGVIPQQLTGLEIAHAGLTELYTVKSMHERKEKMYQLASYFLTIPGGIGTMDELFEIVTWAQLGLHQKPCGLYNFKGYYDPLIKQLEKMVSEGFLSQKACELFIIDSDLRRLMDKLEAAQQVSF